MSNQDNPPNYPENPPPNTVWTSEQRPKPVTPENPLAGLETSVLKIWLANSRRLKKAYQASDANRQRIESEVRESVETAYRQELLMRAQGLSQEEAEEFTRPAMWTPPMWNPTPTSPAPTPAVKPLATSSSTEPPTLPPADGAPNSTTALPPSDS